jgi:hypothetical protein
MDIDYQAQLRDPDPNEAYEIIPSPIEDGWFIVLQNGIPYCNARYLHDAKAMVSSREKRDYWRRKEISLRPNRRRQGTPSKMLGKAYQGLAPRGS